MTSNGKKLRLSRIIGGGPKKAFIVPIDHGLTSGPISGLEQVDRMSSWLASPLINAVLGHKGIITRLIQRAPEKLADKAVIVHLNGTTNLSNEPYQKLQLTSVNYAVSIGADAVSLDLNFDGVSDTNNLVLLGKVVESADKYGLPVLVMVKDKRVHGNHQECIESLRKILRCTIELGADMVKITTDLAYDSIPEITKDLCHDIEMFMAGGRVDDEAEVLSYARVAFAAGCRGLCIGRNIFQRENPSELLLKLNQLSEGVYE